MCVVFFSFVDISST